MRRREFGFVLRAPDVSAAAQAGAGAVDGRIVVSGLSKQYRKVRAVDDLSFVVEPGRVTGFLGPNGAGKTTTLRMVLGLVRPTAGSATIGGMRYAGLRNPLSVVGAVLEASSAHRGRSGRNHLRVICATAGVPDARVDEVLAMAGLSSAARRAFRGYSLGMRQRLAIAAAMIGDPRVLVLDEPANGLDPEGIKWMRGFLKGLAADGRTIVVSSHLLAEMEVLADDLVIIAAGKLVAQGTVQDILSLSRATAAVYVRTPNAPELTAAVVARGGVVTSTDDGRLKITGVAASIVGAAASAGGAEVHDLSTSRADLEAVFLDLTGTRAAMR
ncbi:ATP-binding cassette domain-containing protein [Kribbella sp. NBC_00709]|uniref:ABC transporter ATP-binding protein n=1 Tax=Kribbella sp. NBC_00709 TaxID=2975972 RepID=UPI002E295E27|nr:ATP-binding cassette domain-containing protein [Kribbella sp. NBC_00709]